MSWPHLSLAICLLTLTACSLTPLGTTSDVEFDEDEQRLWQTVVEEERRLDSSGLVYADASINQYLDSVLRKLYPKQSNHVLSVEVRVLKNPLLNAFAYPNGRIYVHTGMLARIESEAQLAALLGHELTHATHRHSIQTLRGARRTIAVLATLQAVGMPFGVFGAAATMLGAVGSMAAVSGYSRSKEAEADELGLALVVQAGYSPHEAPKLFEKLRDDLAFRKVKEPFFFGSHPRLQDRIDSYQDLIASKYSGHSGVVGTDRYYEIMTPLMVDNAETDLAIGRFALAQRDLEQVLSRQPTYARAHFLLGEVCRQRREPGDAERSEVHYRQAIEADPRFPDSYRALGYALLQRGDSQGGKAELRRYLDLAPRAPDREYVELALKEAQ